MTVRTSAADSAPFLTVALMGFRGLRLPCCPRNVTHFQGYGKIRASKEERRTQVGLDTIDTSTTLESNTSLPPMRSTVKPRRNGTNFVVR